MGSRKESSSEEDKELMRRAQFGRCAVCRKPLGDDAEGHALYRSHAHWTQRALLCPECHKKTLTNGRPNPFGV